MNFARLEELISATSPLVGGGLDVANDNIHVTAHDDLQFNNAEHRIDAVAFVERMMQDAQIFKQSELIAHKLVSAGFDPYLKTESKVSMIGLITGAQIDLSKYRNINIIPEVAQRNRLALINDFKLFLQEHPRYRKYARYMVVTSGRRFPIADFPERLKAFNVKLGRYLEICKGASIECLLVSIEFTIDDDSTVNLHANVVTSPKKAFGPNCWTAWLHETRAHFDEAIIHDAGRVQDPAEIIKYVCKYNEIVSLGGRDTAFIAEALCKRQMVRPVGAFKKWRSDLKKAGQKVRFDHACQELVRCQVSKRKKADGDDWTEEEVMEDIFDDCDRMERERRRQLAARAGKLKSGEDRDPIQNQILCTTLPQNRASLLAEPFVVVVNFNGDPRTENGKDGLAAIEARRRHHFKILAEHMVPADEIAREAGSILDTLTIIPRRFSSAYFRLSPKRHERVRKLLGLAPMVPSLDAWEAVEEAVSEALERHFPKQRHEWSPEVSDVSELLSAGMEKQELFLEGVDHKRTVDGLRAEDSRAFATSRFDRMTDAQLDDVIPY